MPTRRAEIKNTFLFMLLTRMIRKEFEKVQSQFSKYHLDLYISKNGVEKVKTNTLFLHLCDFENTRIVVTPETLAINGINLEKLKGAPKDIDVIKIFIDTFGKDFIFSGWVCEKDRAIFLINE